MGAGPIGQLVIAALAHVGTDEIIAADLSVSRLALAQEMGAHNVLNVGDTSLEERQAILSELCDGVGPDIVIETAGVPVAFQESLELVRRGGIAFPPDAEDAVPQGSIASEGLRTIPPRVSAPRVQLPTVAPSANPLSRDVSAASIAGSTPVASSTSDTTSATPSAATARSRPPGRRPLALAADSSYARAHYGLALAYRDLKDSLRAVQEIELFKRKQGAGGRP